MSCKLYNFFKIILFFTLLFLFLPSFYLPDTNVPVYDIVIALPFILFMFLLPKDIRSNICKLSRYIHFKILLLFIFWVFFVGILFVILGKYYISHFLYATLLLFFYNNISWYIFPCLNFPNFFSLRFLIKFLFLGIYIICIYGLLVYLFNLLGLNILDYIQDIINNRREEIVTLRVLSVFEEPSAMGSFMSINLPILYTLSLSKFKIFKNNILNIFIKRTYIPLIIVTVLCIQSPMWLILILIITTIYFLKQILRFLKKYFIYIVIFVSVSFLTLQFTNNKNLDITDTFLNRIVKVVTVLGNWDSIVIADPSFANRISNYYARTKLWQEYPITGVGYKNTEYNIRSIFYNKMKITLTKETNNSISESYQKGGYVLVNGSILWILLSDTGFVGTILFFLFLLFSINKLNKIIKKVSSSLYRDFMIGLSKSIITLICISVYSININTVYIWFLLGVTNVFVLYFDKLYIERNNLCLK